MCLAQTHKSGSKESFYSYGCCLTLLEIYNKKAFLDHSSIQQLKKLMEAYREEIKPY